MVSRHLDKKDWQHYSFGPHLGRLFVITQGIVVWVSVWHNPPSTHPLFWQLVALLEMGTGTYTEHLFFSFKERG